MSSLTLRRIVVWVVSMAVGFLITALFIMLVLPWMGPHGGEPITIADFGTLYFLTAAIPLGLVFMVWLDYFLDTRILPD